ncbi:nuclear transport factor 2 family protein [Prochlorothrix hollandica]|uniref:Protein kinase n=1 Tax=Prochlorothrix hollandica PCC 9006 = CALU 1027 TaxID=317619 RepID=A0A0M2Q2B6_PROHO|nr:nuclear transport factor 2 family protein [Prochlorothrix hollandica]KKJ01403.1 protein kinase [Prochlorothrix hollandica PCC 9006 = CALU 1027]
MTHDPETPQRSVLMINNAFYRAFEKKNLEAMAEVWSQGSSCLCVHPGRQALKGWAAIAESWEQIFYNTDYIEINTEVITTEVYGDAALVVLVEHVLQISGQRRVEAQSMATNVFEHLGSRWYLLHHHGSPVLA